MHITGIIAEYNPFHNGHRYQIEKTRKELGSDIIIVIMSGNYVQRGIPALYDKYFRCRMALLGGADIVIELPTAFSTASAEYFAEGGIRLLNSFGVVDDISFGSECGDINIIMNTAKKLVDEAGNYNVELTRYLKEGYSYPKALQLALGLDEQYLSNDILGTEYCKALYKTNSKIVPHIIKRSGMNYNDSNFSIESNAFASASALREFIMDSSVNCDIKQSALIKACGFDEDITREMLSYNPISLDDFSDIIYSILLNEDRTDILKILDMNNDIYNSLCNELINPFSATELIKNIKSKRYTYSMLSRLLLHLALHINSELVEEMRSDSYIPYGRLLGFNKKASSVIKDIKKKGNCRIITKLADADISDIGIQLDIKASRLYYQLMYTKNKRIIQDEFKQSPIIL